MNNRCISGPNRAIHRLWLVLVALLFPLTVLAHSGLRDGEFTTEPSPAASQPYLYTGEQIDPNLGMYYLRARYYQPGLGRFWTIDSFEGDMEEPASLHKYLYCHGNPVNLVDPSGHMGLASFSVSSIGNTMLSITIRATPLLNKATIIAFEAATGNTVIMGGGAAIGTAAAMSKIPGGLSAWTRLAQALDGAVVGPYQSLRSVLTRSGRNAHHINPTAVYPRIPRDTGAAVDLVGGGRGSEHNFFHASMRSFFRPFQPGGALYGQRPNNQQVRDAMREAYRATGRFLDDQIDELIEFAEKEQRAHGYWDGNGGNLPRIPDLN